MQSHELVALQFDLHLKNLHWQCQCIQPNDSWTENRIQKLRDYPIEIWQFHVPAGTFWWYYFGYKSSWDRPTSWHSIEWSKIENNMRINRAYDPCHDLGVLDSHIAYLFGWFSLLGAELVSSPWPQRFLPLTSIWNWNAQAEWFFPLRWMNKTSYLSLGIRLRKKKVITREKSQKEQGARTG